MVRDFSSDEPTKAAMSVQEAAAHVDGLLRFHKGLEKMADILHLAVDIEAETMHKQAVLQDVNANLTKAQASLKGVQVEVLAAIKQRDELRAEVAKIKAAIGNI